MSIRTMDVEDCRRALASGETLAILDVRTPGEFARVHATGARLLPLDQMDAAKVAKEDCCPGKPLYIICQSGARATKACQRLQDAGASDVILIEGGTVAWEGAGLPVVHGSGKTISLERQVRIGAGSLVLIGSLLAFFVHPYFLALPAFVGSGLIFAGITDYCGMGKILGLMPWNRG